MVLELSTTKYSCRICHKCYDRRVDAVYCETICEKNRKIENMERLRTFTITENHLKLLKNMYVDWDNCEFGAPCIDPKRPYGNSDGVNDVARVIDLKKTKENVEDYDKNDAQEYENQQEYLDDLDYNKKTYDQLYYLHREMQVVLQICLTTQKFEVGKYKKKDEYDSQSWVKVE